MMSEASLANYNILFTQKMGKETLTPQPEPTQPLAAWTQDSRQPFEGWSEMWSKLASLAAPLIPRICPPPMPEWSFKIKSNYIFCLKSHIQIQIQSLYQFLFYKRRLSGFPGGTAVKNLPFVTSLVEQQIKIHKPMQRTRVQSLVPENATCWGATKPMNHATEARAPKAHARQQEKPLQWESSSHSLQPEKAYSTKENPGQPKIKWINK